MEIQHGNIQHDRNCEKNFDKDNCLGHYQTENNYWKPEKKRNCEAFKNTNDSTE